MKKINLMLQKCKSLSRQLVKTSSYTGVRSKSITVREHHCGSGDARGIIWKDIAVANYYNSGERPQETVFVGSTRKQYVIDSKYLSHPVVKALIGRSSNNGGDNAASVINCEVVLFDHLLWMLDQNCELNLNSDSLDELADLYYLN